MNALHPTAGLATLLALSLVVAPSCGSESASDDPGTEPSPAGATDDSGADTTEPAPVTAKPPADANRFAPGGSISDADLAQYHVSMTCEVEGEDIGTMTFTMWTEAAPIATRNFLRLCDEGFYDGISFHRIMRAFMIQGGDPTGTGSGNSPHGTIMAEFSDAPERAHGYGVLSMARMGNDVNSASCQFFLCCDESPSVWGLDGNYTSFGRLTGGVETLEAIANVPTRMNPRGEPSIPTKTVTITKASVHEGAAPTGETIVRPQAAADLDGEPERIVVQHVLISFEGCGIEGVTRTQEEAETLANEVLEALNAGSDMDTLVREKSDDQVTEGDTTPGHYRLLNNGVRDPAGERKSFELENDFRKAIEAMQVEMRAGNLTSEDYQSQGTALQAKAQIEVMEVRFVPRAGLVPAFGDVGFSLDVGEVGIATYDATASPFGFHVIKRIE